MNSIIPDILRQIRFLSQFRRIYGKHITGFPYLISKNQLHLSCGIYKKQIIENENSSAAKKKPTASPKVNLVNNINNSITIVTLEEAQKLSRRRDLKLIKIQDIDGKTQRPTYKLVTASELLAEDSSSEHQTVESPIKRTEKQITIGSRIEEHDLNSRLKNISKWLKKNHEIRVLIQSGQDDYQKAEKLFGTIENLVKEEKGRIMQKQIKNGNIKFNILSTEATNKQSSS